MSRMIEENDIISELELLLKTIENEDYIKIKYEHITNLIKESLNLIRKYQTELEQKNQKIKSKNGSINALQDALRERTEERDKKDDIIRSIREYVQQEIAFATEDIEDYIDDDREGNKNIIGELKEWREHWKDIIRIMNNEKTYMDFLYKIQV